MITKQKGQFISNSQRICTAGELSEGEIRILECGGGGGGAAVQSLWLYRLTTLVLNINIVAQNLAAEHSEDSCDQSKYK